MKIIEESRLRFSFPDSSDVLKFDDCEFFRKMFTGLDGNKGVDIISSDMNKLVLMEIKNFKGYERENRWRLLNHNMAKGERHGKDSLDIEFSKKIRATIACLAGAATHSGKLEEAKKLGNIYNELLCKDVRKDKKRIMAILFLEGDIALSTRSEKLVMMELRKGIESYLRWLNCDVMVINTKTDIKLFKVEEL